MSVESILVPKIIANLSWSEARELLQTKYDLSIDETDKLFCAKYIHDSRLWTRGTDEQKLMLTQNRGTIYEKLPPYRLICLPFYKFWNYNEPQAATKHANWTLFTEKLDGTFFKVYYYDNQWHVSSNSRIDIKQYREKYQRSGKTNDQLWQEAALAVNLDYSKLNPTYAYFFERVHPDYRIVIQYTEPKLYHIGTRNMLTLEELEIDIGVPKPRSFDFMNLKQCFEYVSNMSFMSGEGIVACDRLTYDRIKIKSPSYLIAHCRTTGVDFENKDEYFCLTIWLFGEKQEYLNYFPEYISTYNQIERQLEEILIPKLIDEFNEIDHRENREFFNRLNLKYPSTGKPEQDRKRLIFTKLYQQQSDDYEDKRDSLRKILRQRNFDNNQKFIFEKYLRLLKKKDDE